MLGASLWVAGCATQADAVQEGAIVPADAQLLGTRADAGRLKGDTDAPVRIVEISDFQCPFCKQFHEETLTKIDSAYIQTGKVNYLWVSYANPGHPLAFGSSEAAFCAGSVGLFWPMHDILFERQEEWSGQPDAYEYFVQYATEIGVDTESFEVCLRNSTLAPLLLRDFSSVTRAGISSTPYFILADSVAIRGAADFATFQAAIDTLLVLKGSP